MNYSIDASSTSPAYIQIYQQIREDILSGFYPYGSKIPSKRILATETGVSVITIKHAIELLSEEGYIETKERSGYFVVFRKDDFLGSPISSTLPINRRESNTSDTFPYTVIAKTMRKVILDYENSLFTKCPNSGCPELRIEICNYLARSRSIHVKPNQVVIGSGAEYLYGLIAQLFGSDKKFAIENPSYSKISNVYDAFNITYDRLTLLPDGINSEELKATTASVLHTTPFNSYPSGISIDSSKKHEYLRWANKNERYIIEDNYDSELTVSRKHEDTLFSLAGGKNVIYVNTFSKTIAPSIRIGYMILPESLIDVFEEKLGFYSCTVPVFDQYVLAELLHNGDFERHINRIRRKKRKELN